MTRLIKLSKISEFATKVEIVRSMHLSGSFPASLNNIVTIPIIVSTPVGAVVDPLIEMFAKKMIEMFTELATHDQMSITITVFVILLLRPLLLLLQLIRVVRVILHLVANANDFRPAPRRLLARRLLVQIPSLLVQVRLLSNLLSTNDRQLSPVLSSLQMRVRAIRDLLVAIQLNLGDDLRLRWRVGIHIKVILNVRRTFMRRVGRRPQLHAIRVVNVLLSGEAPQDQSLVSVASPQVRALSDAHYGHVRDRRKDAEVEKADSRAHSDGR